jgi:hypothetical protein
MTRTRTTRRPPPAQSRNGDGDLSATARLPLGGHARVPAGAAPSTNGRDGGGKFTVGNRCGRGNPFMRQLSANRSAILKVVGPEQVEQLIRTLLQRALCGDLDAARVLLSYSVGRPGEVADPDDVDGDELRRLLKRPLALEVILSALEGVDPARVIDHIKDAHAKKPADPTAALGDKIKLELLAQLRRLVLVERARGT